MSEKDPKSLGGPRYLVVRGETTGLRLALPSLGSISIGESPASDVRIAEAGIASEHAVLFLDHGIGLKATGGDATVIAHDAKGRPKREQKLEEGETAELEVGDRVRLGPAELTFAESAPVQVAGRRIFSREFFERRLGELVAGPGRPSMAVAIFRIAGSAGAEALEQALDAPLRPNDLVGDLGNGEYGVAFLEVSESRARGMASTIAASLESGGFEVLAGVASAGPGEGGPREMLEIAAQHLAPTAQGSGKKSPLVAVDPEMQKVVKVVERAAKSGAHVLILGETGTGKDRIAQLVHDLSDRAEGPFVRVSTVDLPDSIWEERPAPAFLKRARGGTLYFDEVGSFTLRGQLGLGYLLEEPPSVHDVRFIASTHEDLGANVASGTFRKDLLFRLNKLSITIPPLRARSADIVPLAELFITEAAEAAGRDVPVLTEAAKDRLAAHRWPGNVRELKNVIEHAMLLCSGSTLGTEHLPEGIGEEAGDEAGAAESGAGEERDGPKPTNLRDEIAALEKRRIMEALRKYPTQREAALSLNMPMRTFLNRLDALGIPRARGGGQKDS